MFDKKATSIVVSVVSALNLLLFLSMRSMLGFVGYALHFAAAPYIMGVILAAMVVLSFFELLEKHNKKLLIALFVLDCVFLIFDIAFFVGCRENYKMFLVEMAKLILVYAAIALIVYLIFYFPKSKIYTKTVATIVCSVLVAGIVFGFTDVGNLKINFITTGAAVYAVEDEYQIVWTTRAKATAWVEVGGEKYYDEIAGSLKSTETVHKVTVPQSALDRAKEYTIYSKTMINEEAFSALLGRTFKKTYTFRPVDESDGIQYYAVSDLHGNNSKAYAVTSYFGQATDFIVIAGDAVSYVYGKPELERLLKLAHGVSGGNIPVIYARGNHELKGEGAEILYKYVGANAQNEYYYSFRLGSIWGVVLDMGEDHDDDWKEFFGTANFKPYRAAQLNFLDELIADKNNTYDAPDVRHRIAISHAPVAFVGGTEFFMFDELIDFNTRLNQMNLDVMINGHLHEVFLAPKGTVAGEAMIALSEYTPTERKFYSTGAMYDTIVCARRSNAQSRKVKEHPLGKTYTGTAFWYKTDTNSLEVRFTTDKKKVISTINPFTGESYGNTIYLY
ncbi:MAG TPA: metallophosphoesterase [Clostridia bacterium]|nr:metallophosphoesterase [Clostridia bacterium]